MMKHVCGRATRGAPGLPSRRGFMLAELVMSAVMLMIAMALVVKVVAWVAAERRGVERREWAVQEASNLLETITARPFDAVTPEALEKLTLSPQARQALPGAELEANVAGDEAAGGPGSKRIRVRIRWRDRSGGWDAPVRMATWIYAGRPRP